MYASNEPIIRLVIRKNIAKGNIAYFDIDATLKWNYNQMQIYEKNFRPIVLIKSLSANQIRFKIQFLNTVKHREEQVCKRNYMLRSMLLTIQFLASEN